MINFDKNAKVLADIQARVPQEWRAQLMQTIKVSPDMERFIKKVLRNKDLPPEKHKQLEILFRTGEFSKTKEVLNEAIAKKIDDFVGREIKRAIQLKLLDKPEQMEHEDFIKQLNEHYASKENKAV